MKHQHINMNHALFIPTVFPEEHITKSKLSPNETTSMHVQTLPTILLVTEGTLYVTVHQQNLLLNKEDILIIFKGNPYSLSTDEQGCTFYTLAFYPFSYREASNIFVPPTDTNLNILCEFSFRYKHFLQLSPSTDIHHILDNMYREYLSKNIYYTEILISYSISLLFLVFREMKFISAKKDIYINTHFIEALKFLDANYQKKFTIDNIAKYSNVSARYLNKLFHSALGTSLSKFIVSFRIDKALDIMFHNEIHSLTEIAINVGFSSLQHFSKAFKEETGISPKTYQLLLDSKKTK